MNCRLGLNVLKPLVLAGPTASGKSALALALAQRLEGEIICADSRQIYEGMRIASAGPSDDEKRLVKHHLYQSFSPTVEFDAQRFIEEVDATIDDVLSRQKWPIVVGGAGLYLRAFRYGLDDAPPKDDAIRERLTKTCDEKGLPFLYRRLQSVDPTRASQIDENDALRVIRALEIYEVTGAPPSTLRLGFDPSRPLRRTGFEWVRLRADRTWLRERINRRGAQMFREGMLEEALLLKERLGEHPLLKTMGTEEALALAQGDIDEEEAIEVCQRRQRAYAKRQRTWFKKEEWWRVVDVPRPLSEILTSVEKWVSNAAIG